MNKVSKDQLTYCCGFIFEITTLCDCGKQKDGIARKIVGTKELPQKDGEYIREKKGLYHIGKNGVIKNVKNKVFCKKCAEKSPVDISLEADKADRQIARADSK